MKITKRLIGICLAVLLISLTACGGEGTSQEPKTSESSEPAQAQPLSAMVLKGPSAISAAELMQKSDSGETNYDITMVGSPDEVVSALSSASTDVAIVPTNLAANLYNKTDGDVRMVAITTLGSLYLVSQGDQIDDMSDLRGKAIYAGGQGSNPQFILEYLLTQSGLTIGQDVFVEYVAEHSEAVALLATGEAEVVLLPEPFVTTALAKDPQAKIAVDLSEVWKEKTGNDFAMSCLVARTDYLENNQEAASAFLGELEKSVEFCSANTEACAQLCVDYAIVADYDTAFAAIPRCQIVYFDGAEMKSLVAEYFQVLFDANPASVGGSIPDDAFFYEG